MSSNAQVRRRAVQAARGESPFDLLLIDAQIVDMATGEIRAADVGIVGEMIASVHPRGSREDAHEVRSLAGGYLSPGLMDTHVHLESSHLPPERYAEIVLTRAPPRCSGIRMSWPTSSASLACAMRWTPAAICRCR